MKNNILKLIMVLIILPIMTQVSKADIVVVSVTMGVPKLLGVDPNGNKEWACVFPYDKPCNVCSIANVPNTSYINVPKFYFTSDNPEIGVGYTHIDVSISLDPVSGNWKETITQIYSTNQMFTNYTAWLNATGLTRP